MVLSSTEFQPQPPFLPVPSLEARLTRTGPVGSWDLDESEDECSEKKASCPPNRQHEGPEPWIWRNVATFCAKRWIWAHCLHPSISRRNAFPESINTRWSQGQQGRFPPCLARVFRRRGTLTEGCDYAGQDVAQGQCAHHDQENSPCSAHQAILRLSIPAEEFP